MLYLNGMAWCEFYTKPTGSNTKMNMSIFGHFCQNHIFTNKSL